MGFYNMPVQVWARSGLIPIFVWKYSLNSGIDFFAYRKLDQNQNQAYLNNQPSELQLFYIEWKLNSRALI